MSAEEWRAVAGQQNYEVSNLGRVRSLPRTYNLGYEHRGVVHNAGGILRPTLMKGALRISMGTNRTNRKHYVLKKVVWEAFHDKLPPGRVIICEDGDPMNTALSNLRVITRRELLQMNVRAVKELR